MGSITAPDRNMGADLRPFFDDDDRNIGIELLEPYRRRKTGLARRRR